MNNEPAQQHPQGFICRFVDVLGHILYAAPSPHPSVGWDETAPHTTAEVPIESIQQFVQIYGIVRDNYVDQKSDDALFQQAIKGLVSGLDRYSRYLSAEEYRQLIQYTEGDLASVDFNLNYDSLTRLWRFMISKQGRIPISWDCVMGKTIPEN